MTDDRRQQMVSLDDVLGVIENQMSPPDSYFYAKQSERMLGWVAAAARIMQKMEELPHDR